MLEISECEKFKNYNKIFKRRIFWAYINLDENMKNLQHKRKSMSSQIT